MRQRVKLILRCGLIAKSEQKRIVHALAFQLVHRACDGFASSGEFRMLRLSCLGIGRELSGN